MGKSIGTEGKHLRLLEKGEAADLWQMGQGEKYRQSVPWSYVLHTGMCVHRCARGLGAGAWGLEDRPRVRTAVGCGETD